MATELKPDQQRVVVELTELADKISKLQQLIGSDKYAGIHPDERARLIVQEYFMRQYAGILKKRVEAFT